MPWPFRPTAIRAALPFVGVAAITFVYVRWLHVTDATTAALSYLLLVASRSRRRGCKWIEFSKAPAVDRTATPPMPAFIAT